MSDAQKLGKLSINTVAIINFMRARAPWIMVAHFRRAHVSARPVPRSSIIYIQPPLACLYRHCQSSISMVKVSCHSHLSAKWVRISIMSKHIGLSIGSIWFVIIWIVYVMTVLGI